MARTKRELTRGELGNHVAHLISNDRNNTHGDPHEQFETAQRLKAVLMDVGRPSDTSLCEALDMICTKLSRIVCGTNLQDHWLDIAGYALIAAEGAEKPLTTEK